MASPVQVGDTVAGKYRVDAILGQGGMGVVVAATDTILDRLVAVKFLLPQYAENETAAGRFLREARATARLNSEHAVRIIEVGQLDTGSPFMAMEFLQGVDLGTYIEQQGALEIKVAVDYVLQACQGLAEAHKAGIIHRDVKPSNLFLAYQTSGKPVVKVLDFGVSKLNLGLDANSGSLTTTGQTLGSPLYMSPEQMRSSQAADARSDLWGLGVVLFELLTGARPFSADSLTELVLVINQEPPLDPKVLRPDLPDTLCRVVLKALEKDPNRRYSTVSEFADALAPFGSRDSRAAARAIKGVMDSDVSIPGAPPMGRLGTLIVDPSEHSLGTSAFGASGGVSVGGVSLAAPAAGEQQGSKTSAPWASTRDRIPEGATKARRKPKVALWMFGVGGGVGALAIVGVALLMWSRSAETKPEENDSAIVSAASELERSLANERAERQDSAENASSNTPSVRVEPTASATSSSGAGGGSAQAAKDDTRDESASETSTSEDKTSSPSLPRRRVRPPSASDQPKSAKDRLGF